MHATPPGPDLDGGAIISQLPKLCQSFASFLLAYAAKLGGTRVTRWSPAIMPQKSKSTLP
jgi:hypothetical protein